MGLQRNSADMQNYIVVGLLDRRTGRPKEKLIVTIPEYGLFEVIKRISGQLRPWWRSAFSLKTIQGFSAYQCTSDNLEHHVSTTFQGSIRVEIDEFFQDYRQYPRDYGDHWMEFVRRHFNGGDDTSKKERYALQLVLRWSTTKIAIYGLTPILLSLAIGFWYQTTSGSDPNIVKQTAWAIATYIIAATARKFLGKGNIRALLIDA